MEIANLTGKSQIPEANNQLKVKKVKISLLQAVEAHRVARGQGSHVT
jgi:hypothetical protein